MKNVPKFKTPAQSTEEHIFRDMLTALYERGYYVSAYHDADGALCVRVLAPPPRLRSRSDDATLHAGPPNRARRELELHDTVQP